MSSKDLYHSFMEQLGQGLASLRKIKLWIQVEDKTGIKQYFGAKGIVKVTQCNMTTFTQGETS